MTAVVLFFLILAFVLFIVVGAGLSVRRVNLLAFGLASWVLAELLPRIIGGA